jgi:protein phosphatase
MRQRAGGSKSPQIRYLSGCGICEPETGQLDFKDNDLLILNTDGLHKKLPVDTMIFLLRAETSLATKAKSLVQAALDAGGKDNITLVIAEKKQDTN